MTALRILGISGSLRDTSSSTALLRTVGELMPEHIHFTLYDELALIPPFNDEAEMPQKVKDFVSLINESSAVIICQPEYAFGIAGALKNAIDWTVGTTAFSDKYVAVITAASVGKHAHAALLLVLSALGASTEESTNLLVPFIRSQLDSLTGVMGNDLLAAVRQLIHVLVHKIFDSSTKPL